MSKNTLTFGTKLKKSPSAGAQPPSLLASENWGRCSQIPHFYLAYCYSLF